MWTITILASVCTLLAGFILGWIIGKRSAEAGTQVVEENLKSVFQALAAEQMDKNTDRFFKLADERDKTARDQLARHQEAVTNLMKPLSDKIELIDKQRQEMYGRLANELKRVTEANEKLRIETTNLTNALRQPQVRGRWGETTLRRVVELAGMVDHVDFVEQESTTTVSGRLRPDMTIHLPNGHAVVVDSKVALDAYLQANAETDETRRDEILARHARHMRDHMQQLSQKQYWDHLSEGTEFVVMFVPGDHFLTAALRCDTALIDDAMQKRVVIATPATLIALLRAIEYGWRHAALETNAREISRLGRELYRRCNMFIEHLAKVRKGLQAAVDGFNAAVGSFQQLLLPGMRKFKELKADDGKDPAELTEIEKTTRILPPEEEISTD